MNQLLQGHLRPFLSYLHDLMSHIKFAGNAAGLLYLADLHSVALRSALTGTSSLLDALVICPGAHRLQDAPNLSKSEFPACAAMTTGYVFRVENEATVLQLQRVGKPGHLTTLTVSTKIESISGWSDLVEDPASACYATVVTLTVSALSVLIRLEDFGAVLSLVVLILTRVVNALVFRRRSRQGWKGAPEPGVHGDLLVLLSQDRWIRIRGLVDDIKAMTSGQWLRDTTFHESVLVSISTLTVYLNAAFASAISPEGQALLIGLLLASAALIGLANQLTHVSHMYGRYLVPDGPAKPYHRRLDLAAQLIEETGRDDWALRLGMIQPNKKEVKAESDLGPKIM